MTVKYYAILTNQGAARLANATMLGSKLNLTQMAVGDANGVLPTPDPAQTKLINQKRIAPLNLLSVDPNNQSQIIAEQIIPENEGGFWIREIGLYDDEGVLIAVANCPETYKPQLQEGSGRTQTIRMILVVTNTEAITLKIDPSVVLATRKYVDDKISEHEQSRRHPDASLTVKGFTQLSSAINSESETLAATPKAVKAAYDLANEKYTAQNATTTQKGIVQLSSATNSTSETLAATPKAVKAVMDETNKKAPLNSPALTGTPTTPTAPQGTNSTQIASTAFVMAAIAALVDSSPDALNTLNELAAALGNDPNFATTMTNALAGKQPKDATLTALAELATSADKLPYFTGADRAALTALTSVGRAILGKTSTQGVLDYLGLGEAAKRNVGNGENQIPDMSFWTVTGGNGNFVIRQPDGLIIQMVTVSISGPVAMNGMTDNAYAITGSNKSYIATATLPFVFPNKVLGVIPLVSTTAYGGVSSNITGSYATAVCSFAAVRGNNTIVFKVDKPLNAAFPSDTSVSALIIGR